MTKLSAIVLTRNEETNLARCLASLHWCDEIIVLDDFSSDQTPLRAAKSRKAKLFRRHTNGDLAAQRNFALDKASGEWVLFVDADEEVSPVLAKEINGVLSGNKNMSGYFLRRRDSFWGRWLNYGETGNVKLLRLAKKSAGRWRRRVHETWHVSGRVGEMQNPLWHYPHPTIHDFLASINRWTEIDAGELTTEGKSFRFFRVFVNPTGKFLQNYILKLCFLDGLPGFVSAFMMSLHSLIVRVKQYDLATKPANPAAKTP